MDLSDKETCSSTERRTSSKEDNFECMVAFSKNHASWNVIKQTIRAALYRQRFHRLKSIFDRKCPSLFNRKIDLVESWIKSNGMGNKYQFRKIPLLRFFVDQNASSEKHFIWIKSALEQEILMNTKLSNILLAYIYRFLIILYWYQPSFRLF